MTEEEFFEELLHVALRLHKLPSRPAFELLASPMATMYAQERYGDWRQAVASFREWLSLHHPGSPLLTEDGDAGLHETTPVSRESIDKVAFGAPLKIQGMRYAPVNEMGVIYLFGVLAEDLGYVVEAIRPTFPDCEAKRRSKIQRHIAGRPEVWEKVMIEFEFRASGFQEHIHKAEKCDLVVCWENDWPECPVEVLELKSLVLA